VIHITENQTIKKRLFCCQMFSRAKVLFFILYLKQIILFFSFE